MRPSVFKALDEYNRKQADFAAWCKRRQIATDDWITLSGRDSNGDKHGGARVLLDDDGAIVYGLGGGHAGKKLSEAFADMNKGRDVRGQRMLFSTRADKRRDKKEDAGRLERERKAVEEKQKEQEKRRIEKAISEAQKRIDEQEKKRGQEQQERKARAESERKQAQQNNAQAQARNNEEYKRDIRRQFARVQIPTYQKNLADLEKQLPELKQRADAVKEFLRGKDTAEMSIKGQLDGYERVIKKYDDAVIERDFYKSEINRLQKDLDAGK